MDIKDLLYLFKATNIDREITEITTFSQKMNYVLINKLGTTLTENALFMLHRPILLQRPENYNVIATHIDLAIIEKSFQNILSWQAYLRVFILAFNQYELSEAEQNKDYKPIFINAFVSEIYDNQVWLVWSKAFSVFPSDVLMSSFSTI